jgi:quercetin dioxygenase-like cupin family protein
MTSCAMMRSLLRISLALAMLLPLACGLRPPAAAATAAAPKPVFPLGQPIANGHFTGQAWLHPLSAPDSLRPVSIGNVTFAPGARTYWHRHPAGQILLVTAGEGYYQEEGQLPRRLNAGDVVDAPPGVAHWHGAAPHVGLTHVAINPDTRKGGVTWLHPVPQEEYGRIGQP